MLTETRHAEIVAEYLKSDCRRSKIAYELQEELAQSFNKRLAMIQPSFIFHPVG